MSTEEMRKWSEAKVRAAAEQLRATRIAPTLWFVQSGTHEGAFYRVEVNGVQPSTCSCPAGVYGLPCKHRALVLDQLGLL